MYQLTSTAAIVRLSDNAHIPADPENRDYAAYLAWKAAGNTPELYTPPTPQPITRFSTLDYFSKFTDAEYQAARTGPIAIQRGLDSLIAAQYVYVKDPRVTQYLDALQTAGIIDAARKTELLQPEQPA